MTAGKFSRPTFIIALLKRFYVTNFKAKKPIVKLQKNWSNDDMTQLIMSVNLRKIASCEDDTEEDLSSPLRSPSSSLDGSGSDHSASGGIHIQKFL